MEYYHIKGAMIAMDRPLQKNYLFWVGCFALLNVLMYLLISKFWIGGSSFLPMIGIFGKEGAETAFLFAFIVNIGVIIGSLISALTSKEFILRFPKDKNVIIRAITGGILIGIGITLAPGTCSTVFITGMPMLSINSFISAAGIFIGGFVSYRYMTRRLM
jgi:hypothetical protein